MQTVPFIAKQFHDFWRPFKNVLSTPDQRKAFALIKGMIEGKTVQLSAIGRIVAAQLLPKRWCEKISSSLGLMSALPLVILAKAKRQRFRYFILDESDLQRPYARRLPGVVKVRDGSTGNNAGQGYPLIAVIGVTDRGQYVPILLNRYRDIQTARRQAIATIMRAFGPDHGAIWLVDRGGDDRKLFNYLLEHEQQFLIRLDRQGGQRQLVVADDEQYLISQLTAHMGKVGYRRVQLPGRTEPLTLLHYHHGKQEPLALLTTCSPRTLKQAKQVARGYLQRWKIENYFRFIKDQLALESMMVQGEQAVDGLLTAVLIASSFLMEQLQTITKSPLNHYFQVWCQREQASPNWSALTRFYRSYFTHWSLCFRTADDPPHPSQLSLFRPIPSLLAL